MSSNNQAENTSQVLADGMMAMDDDDSDNDEYFDVNEGSSTVDMGTAMTTAAASAVASDASASAAAMRREGRSAAGGAEIGSSFTTIIAAVNSDEVPTTAAAASSSSTSPAAASDEGSGAVKEVDAAAQKRRAIQSIMRDATLTDLERRLRIQQLMDGSTKPANNNGHGGGPNGFGGGSTIGGGGGISSLLGSAGTFIRGIQSTNGPGGVAAAGGGGAADPTNQEAVSCVHYERKCNVVAPCCNRVFGCRVCHDEMSTNCGPMDRFGIGEVVCKECHTRQGSK